MTQAVWGPLPQCHEALGKAIQMTSRQDLRPFCVTDTGIPEAGSVQEVLLWQTATIRMMYRIVAKAIAIKVTRNCDKTLHIACAAILASLLWHLCKDCTPGLHRREC